MAEGTGRKVSQQEERMCLRSRKAPLAARALTWEDVEISAALSKDYKQTL